MTFQRTTRNIEELFELNMEILDTILAISKRLFEYADKHGIMLEGLDSLYRLVRRAERLRQEIGSTPPRIRIQSSDEDLQPDSSDKDLTEPALATLISFSGSVFTTRHLR